MQTILSIALGGALGAVLRFLISRFIGSLNISSFPYGTFTVNMIGCFIIGFLYTVFEKTLASTMTRAFFLIGLIGAFTTFSTYILETLNLFRDNEILLGFLNIFLSNLFGFISLILGIILARIMFLGKI